MKTKIENNTNMIEAVVENILLWMIMFIGFVSLFFMVLDYSKVLRIKDNMSSLSDYGARMIALNKNESDIITGLNNLKANTVANITSSNLLCNTNTSADNYQAIFNTQTTYTNSVFTTEGANNITSRSVVFNEVNSSQEECTLTISISN